MSGPSGASAAAVTLTVALVVLSPISDAATLRPVGGDRAESWYFFFSCIVRTTWTGTSTVLPCGHHDLGRRRDSERIGPGRVTAAVRLTKGRA